MTQELQMNQEQPTTPVTENVQPEVVAKPAEAPAEAPKEPKISRTVAKLNKKEAELKAKEAILNGRETQNLTIDELVALAKKEPLKVFEKLGIDKEQFIQDIIKSGEAPTVEQEIKTLKEQLEAQKKEFEVKELAIKQQQAERAITNFKQDINNYAKSLADSDLKFVNALGQTDTIYEVVEQHYIQNKEAIDTGKMAILTKEAASKMVEAHLMEDSKKDYEVLKKLFEPTVKKEEPTKQQPNKETFTLTNKQPTITAPIKEEQIETKEQRLKRIAAKYTKEMLQTN